MKYLIIITLLTLFSCKGTNTVDEIKLEKGYRLHQILVNSKDEIYVISKYAPESKPSKYNVRDSNVVDSMETKVIEE